MPRSKPPRKKAARSKIKRKSDGAVPPLDLRALGHLIAELGGLDFDDDPLSQAQAIVYDAWAADAAKEQVRLARKALALSPVCADAYVLLANHAQPDSDEQLELYRRGVEAGEQAVGAAAFEDDVGYFWGLLETRPYMRARQGLADTLWRRGERESAVAHYRDMLRLNPNDNQGIRYVVAACYVELGRDGDLAELLRAYDEEASAFWSYTKVLNAFRGSAEERARGLLAEAIGCNPHVPAYLLGTRRIPKRLPPYYSPGDESEAICYAEVFAKGWGDNPEALAWLARESDSASGRAA